MHKRYIPQCIFQSWGINKAAPKKPEIKFQDDTV